MSGTVKTMEKKMIIRALADLHLYGPKAMNEWTVDKIIAYDIECKKKGIKLLLLGDIIDVKNTLKKYIEEAKADVLKLKKHFGDRYVLGNHELKVIGYQSSWDYVFTNSNSPIIKAIHGQRFFWSTKKSTDWETREPKGISECKFNKMEAINYLDEKFWRDKKIKPKKKLMEKLYDYTHANILLMGHKHPKETFDYMYRGKRFVIFKRGLSEIDTDILPMGVVFG